MTYSNRLFTIIDRSPPRIEQIEITLDFAFSFRTKPGDDNPPTASVQNHCRQVVVPRLFAGESINSAAANWQRA